MKTTRLEKFLINRGLLERFKNNLEKCKWSEYSCIEKLSNNTTPLNLIYLSFEWFRTSEGDDFWHKIHLEWRECLKTNTL